ncbi:MAG: sugar phosphate isomerase/epimerase [Chloroflexi bacterium]|nr:sugar phosphate isomerase/epimerase [Chloroflexota bacterium]
MKYCYANRRHTLYPDNNDSWSPDPNAYNDAFLRKSIDIGMDGLEIGFQVLNSFGDDDDAIKAFAKRLSDAGMPAVAIRAGGSLTAAELYSENKSRLARMIDVAGMIGVGIVNGALSAPQRHPTHPEFSPGHPKSQDASRDAMIYDYERLADELREATDRGAPRGVTISVEVHQNSLVDNSWSAKLVHKLVDRENFGINPDLGNIIWTYDEMEETTEQAIKELAPISVYWHCKNMHRINHPENNRTVFMRVPLSDGEVDYRFALTAMVEAGYKGFMAIEGASAGDQFYQDQKSVDYAESILEDIGAK